MFAQTGRAPAIGLAIVLVIFVAVSLIKLDVPGIYMDSANPDYLSVYLTRPAGSVPAWVYPDNMFFRQYEFPILSSLYGGATPAYVGVPYFKLFGHSVASFRLYHVALAVIIVSLNCWLLNRLIGNSFFAPAATLALALDPTFVFAWRSQFYLQLFPLITFLPALWFLARSIAKLDASGEFDRRTLAVGAALCGFSAWGYWVFALYSGALFLLVIGYYWRRSTTVVKPALIFIAAFLIGYSPFLYGHISILSEFGLEGYLKRWTDVGDVYGVYRTGADDIGLRMRHVFDRLQQLSDGTAIAGLMLGDRSTYPADPVVTITLRNLSARTYGQWLSLTLLAGSFVAAVASARAPRARATGGEGVLTITPEARVVPLFIVVIFMTHMIFGLALGRALYMQHYIMLLPLIYIGFFLAIEIIFRPTIEPDPLRIVPAGAASPRWTVSPLLRSRHTGSIVCAVVLIAMLANHLPQIHAIYRLLGHSGGRAKWSDAINRVAEHAYELPRDAVFAFTQWGYWMGVAIADGAARPIWESLTVDGMIEQIKQRPPQGAYAIVIDTPDFASAVPKIEAQTGLKLQNERAFTNRIGEPAVTIGLFRRP